MLIRIVKLTIEEENISSFEQIFAERKEYIRNHKGCSLLELYRDNSDSRIFFTYSIWESEDDLQAYRNSDFFKNVWSRTKQLFADKPEAWSVHKIESLN